MNEQIVASCIRVEQEPGTGKMLLVFEVLDSDLKKKIKETWARDYQFKLQGSHLVKHE